MICFNCDYTEGAHPAIMDLLNRTNMEQTVGYGEDQYCEEAREFIKKACDNENAYVQFLVGGTQANLTVISAALRPHQGAICAKTGHINIHESGAIEATGHKCIALESGVNGKLTAELIDECVTSHWSDETHEHMVQPKLVYISDSTENGAVYTKAELTAISEVCRKHKLYLYIDGARLGYALMSPKSDVTLHDLCELADVFYIGGTKVGAMMGEAVVIMNDDLKEDFRYLIKQKGGMFAKGRMLGIQFHALFENGLYFEISKHAIDEAFKIANALKDGGVKFLTEPESNQIFPILPNDVIEKLGEKYLTAFWCKVNDNESAIRIATSWATKSENSDALIKDILELIKK